MAKQDYNLLIRDDATQLSLFDDMSYAFNEKSSNNMTIAEAAGELGVSSATVRNWLKDGMLLSDKRGVVTRCSVEACKAHRLGKDKLVSRANKSCVALKDEEQRTSELLEVLKRQVADDAMARNYELSLSEAFKNKEGIYYTPMVIVEDMLRGIRVDETTTFLDPCCGCGNFIVAAIRRGVKPKNIYGFDTDANAVEIAKRRVLALTGQDCPNIIAVDFLSVANRLHERFDLIYTNPPWGKKLSKAEKDRLARLFQAQESNDTCSLFLLASLHLLSDKGRLGFLLPESVLNISSFACLRKTIISRRIDEIKDYGKPFDGIYTKAYSVIISNCAPKDGHCVSCTMHNGNKHSRLQSSFLFNPKVIFNVWTTQEEQDVVRVLFQSAHTTLAGNAEWGLGVVTGDNKNKCKPNPSDGMVPIYRGKDITAEGLAKPSLYISKDLSHCQQVAPLNLYFAPEKLVYRFISNRLVFYCDTAQNLILNSANCLVLHSGFPISGKALSAQFNSALTNWLFGKLYNTHKVLRSDLETLPIVTDCCVGDTFDEQALLNRHNIIAYNGTYRIKA